MLTPPPPKAPWWKNSRGEWFVIVQFTLAALIIFGPRTWPGLPRWEGVWATVATVAGLVLLAPGAVLSGAAVLNLGRNLTPLPYPKEDVQLVDRGAYKIVRHPMYAGLLAMAFGWGLLVRGWLTLLYAILLFVLFDAKSRREERWLRAKLAGYDAYAQRVRKLIPFIY